MDVKEKLVELLQSAPADIMGNHGVGALADHLIANGVTTVVRCKDCIYSYEEFGFIYCTFGPYGDCKVPSQFYCAEGKRKENNGVCNTL